MEGLINQKVVEGKRVVIKCTGAGDPVPTVQVLVNGSPIRADSNVEITTESTNGITTCTVEIFELKRYNAGVYTFVFTNIKSEDSASCTLTVMSPQPEN